MKWTSGLTRAHLAYARCPKTVNRLEHNWLLIVNTRAVVQHIWLTDAGGRFLDHPDDTRAAKTAANKVLALIKGAPAKPRWKTTGSIYTLSW